MARGVTLPWQVLRIVFAHYATIDVTSDHVCDWLHVEHVNRTMSREEILKFLMNFEVVPHILSRNEVCATMDQVMFELGIKDLSFPEFTEVLLRYVLSGGLPLALQ